MRGHRDAGTDSEPLRLPPGATRPRQDLEPDARLDMDLPVLRVRPMSGKVGSVAVCKHGNLARKCELCERDARIEELEAALHGLIGFVIDHMNTGAITDSRYKDAIKAMDK